MKLMFKILTTPFETYLKNTSQWATSTREQKGTKWAVYFDFILQ